MTALRRLLPLLALPLAGCLESRLDVEILTLHRFPTGEPWLRTEETDVGHRVVVVEGHASSRAPR